MATKYGIVGQLEDLLEEAYGEMDYAEFHDLLDKLKKKIEEYEEKL